MVAHENYFCFDVPTRCDDCILCEEAEENWKWRRRMSLLWYLSASLFALLIVVGVTEGTQVKGRWLLYVPIFGILSLKTVEPFQQIFEPTIDDLHLKELVPIIWTHNKPWFRRP